MKHFINSLIKDEEGELNTFGIIMQVIVGMFIGFTLIYFAL